MRWFVRSVVAIVALWVAFAVSPYLALYDLVRAVERNDTALVAERVNLRALRVALAKELLEGYLQETDADGQITPAERQIGGAIVATLADPLLGEMVTPEGLIGLLRQDIRSAGTNDQPAQSFGVASWSDLFALVGRSQARGFRNVYVVVPPKAPADQRYRIQLRLSRLSWKVVNIELPVELRRRLARRIAAAAAPDAKR